MSDNTNRKPSKKYIKHGILAPNEKYNQNIHLMYDFTNPEYENYLNRLESRNKITDNEQFYTNEEIEQLKSEVKEAECPVCLEKINNEDIAEENCEVCSKGHKFHYMCNESQRTPLRRCPICRDEDLNRCNNIYDTFSGGIKKNKTKKRKHKKHNKTKRRKNKKQKK